jgi:hypothetical protein
MKLLRYGPIGKEKPGILDAEGKIRDLSAVIPELDGSAISPAGLAKLRKVKIDKLPLVRGNPRIGSCVANPQKFIAIGLNYSRCHHRHARQEYQKERRAETRGGLLHHQ